LYIPLTRKPLRADLKEFKNNLLEYEVSTHRFSERAKRALRQVDMLEDKVPPHLLASLPHAVDFVGDIAIVEIPPELENYKRMIGAAMLSTHKRVSTVLAKQALSEAFIALESLRS